MLQTIIKCFDLKKLCDISQQSNIKFISEELIIRDFLYKQSQPVEDGEDGLGGWPLLHPASRQRQAWN